MVQTDSNHGKGSKDSRLPTTKLKGALHSASWALHKHSTLSVELPSVQYRSRHAELITQSLKPTPLVHKLKRPRSKSLTDTGRASAEPQPGTTHKMVKLTQTNPRTQKPADTITSYPELFCSSQGNQHEHQTGLKPLIQWHLRAEPENWKGHSLSSWSLQRTWSPFTRRSSSCLLHDQFHSRTQKLITSLCPLNLETSNSSSLCQTISQICIHRQLSSQHLLINTSSHDIHLALQQIGFDLISVKQITAKHPSPEGLITTVAMLHFLVTKICCHKSQTMFSLKNLCNINVTIEAHHMQTGLMQCYNCQRLSHMQVYCKQAPGCCRCWGGPCY